MSPMSMHLLSCEHDLLTGRKVYGGVFLTVGEIKENLVRELVKGLNI
jgi:hypothetical protein